MPHRGVEAGASGGPAPEISAIVSYGPQRLVCVEGGCPRNIVPSGLVECLRRDLRVGMLGIVQILGDDNVTRTLLRNDL
jgi:hypothetical protein